MKLKHKKTGEIIDLDITLHTEMIKPIKVDSYMDKEITLKLLCDEFEDYKPVEPLIEDEKLRNAVRAWAEVNKINECICKYEIHCITFETERGMFISFENDIPIPPFGKFSIAELCGDES